MSVQVFPAEIFDLFLKELASGIKHPDRESRTALVACTRVNRQFHQQASPYIFSSLSIARCRSEDRLNALLDILNANPDIARYIRSFTVNIEDCSSETISAVLRQLRRLRKLGWIGRYPPQNISQDIITIVTSCVGNFFSLPTLHFENWREFPLSLFSPCRQLESLTLFEIGFSEIGPETLSGLLFSSLKTLNISGQIWSDKSIEAVQTIMTLAAPTLTTLIMSDTMIYPRKLMPPKLFSKLNSTVFSVLKSIHWILLDMEHPSLQDTMDPPTLISQFIDYSAPMVNQIEMEFLWKYEDPYQPTTFKLSNGWSPIDKILSSPKYPSLKTFDISLSETRRGISSESDIRWTLNRILPAVSSCSRAEVFFVGSPYSPLFQHTAIHFIF